MNSTFNFPSLPQSRLKKRKPLKAKKLLRLNLLPPKLNLADLKFLFKMSYTSKLNAKKTNVVKMNTEKELLKPKLQLLLLQQPPLLKTPKIFQL